MEHKHLDAAALERLLAVDRSAEQDEHLFHTLAACPVCREAGGWLLELHQAHALPPVFGFIDAVLARSRAEAPQLLQALIAPVPESRLACLRAEPRFASWGLCELLVRESRQAARANAAEAVHLADLAVQALAAEMVTVFHEHNVSREALAALLLFQEAAHRETATADLARRVAASLASAFSPSGPAGGEGRGPWLPVRIGRTITRSG